MKWLKWVGCAVMMPLALVAQVSPEVGYWKASSHTAQSITGDIMLMRDKLTVNQFYTTPVAEIRELSPVETSSLFDVPADSPVKATLYRVAIPGSHVFQHKNTLCGSSEVHWMVARAEGKELNVAFFSNATPPVFERDAIANSTDLCGTFVYGR